MYQQFRGQNADGHEYIIMNSPSCNTISESKTNGKDSGINVSQQLSGTYPCAVQYEKKFVDQENDTFDGTCQNPWTVKQTDSSASSQVILHR